MTRIVWDKTGEHLYETGVDHVVLYVSDSNGTYPNGVAWNGVTSYNESPSGGDANDLWADNIKYLSLRAAEDFGATVEAYTYPDEWAQCDGSAEIAPGVMAGQQGRKMFGLCVRTVLGNDVDLNEHGYLLHLIYGATASPSERSYQTINDSPDAITFSWELTTVPTPVTGFKPTARIVIDSTKADAAKLAILEAVLYGTNDGETIDLGTYNGSDRQAGPRLPMPDEVIDILKS